MSIPTIVVSVAKPGHLQQCLAFCDRMGWPVTGQLIIPGPRRMDVWWRNAWLRFRRRVVEKRVTPLARTAGRLRIVASGTSSETTTGAYRNLYGRDLYAVCIGSPRTKAPVFDLAISSHHALLPGQVPTPSHYRGARTTVWMPGVLVKPLPCNDQAGRAHSTVALIGGKNKAFDFAESALLPRLSAIAEDRDTTLIVVFSRRTPRSLEKRIRAAVAGGRTTFVDRHDRPGFLNAAANAHSFVVTPDSITMTSEAYVTGRPVSLFDLPCFDRNTSTYRFYSELRAMPADRVGEILRHAADKVIDLAKADFTAWLGDRPEAA